MERRARWMMKPRLLLLLALTTTLLPMRLAAQTPDAAERGRQVLARAVEHAGGAERLRELRYFHLRLETFASPESLTLVPASAAATPRVETAEIEISADLLGHRYRREDSVREGMRFVRMGNLVREGREFALAHGDREYTVEPGDGAMILAHGARYVPPVLLQRAAANTEPVNWAGESRVMDQPAEVIEFSWDAATRLRLFISRDTGRVLQLELPAQGGEAQRIVYVSERDAEGYRVPQQAFEVRRGETIRQFALAEVSFSEPITDREFDLPRTYRRVTRELARSGSN